MAKVIDVPKADPPPMTTSRALEIIASSAVSALKTLADGKMEDMALTSYVTAIQAQSQWILNNDPLLK